MPALKLQIIVRAGVLIGTPIFEKSWEWTSEQQERLTSEDPEIAQPAREEWILMHGESREVEASLEDPSKFNWVQREWIWM